MKLKLAAVSAATLLVGLMSASGAQAAYEDPAVEVNLEDATVIEGTTISGSATSNGVEGSFTATFNGSTDSATGTAINFSFETPSVTEETDFPLTVVFTYDDGNTGGASVAATDPAAVTPAATQNVTRTVNVTVLPKGGDTGGDTDADTGGDASDGKGALPDTGGSNALILGGGAALLALGGGALFIARRKSDQVA